MEAKISKYCRDMKQIYGSKNQRNDMRYRADKTTEKILINRSPEE